MTDEEQWILAGVLRVAELALRELEARGATKDVLLDMVEREILDRARVILQGGIPRDWMGGTSNNVR